jgi:anti-anti-sigma factor
MNDEQSDLRLTSARAGSELLVAVAGELDLRTGETFRAHLDGAIVASPGDVALDLSAVTFCDSTALQSLIDAHDRLAAQGRRLRVVKPSRSVDRLLWLSGLAEALYVPAALQER